MNNLLINTANLIKIHEGLKLDVYVDETGHKTIGYGHNLDAAPISLPIPLSIADAETLLMQDINKVLAWIVKYVWWNGLTDNRKMCLIDLGFNLGEGGFHKFVHMISALEISDYTEAANQMRASTWYNEVGIRGMQDYLLMLHG